MTAVFYAIAIVTLATIIQRLRQRFRARKSQVLETTNAELVLSTTDTLTEILKHVEPSSGSASVVNKTWCAAWGSSKAAREMHWELDIAYWRDSRKGSTLREWLKVSESRLAYWTDWRDCFIRKYEESNAKGRRPRVESSYRAQVAFRLSYALQTDAEKVAAKAHHERMLHKCTDCRDMYYENWHCFDCTMACENPQPDATKWDWFACGQCKGCLQRSFSVGALSESDFDWSSSDEEEEGGGGE